MPRGLWQSRFSFLIAEYMQKSHKIILFLAEVMIFLKYKIKCNYRLEASILILKNQKM